MRLWQSMMISLARSKRIIDFMHRSPSMGRFASRYVAGPDEAGAVARASALKHEGVAGSLFYLGEYVDDPAEVAETVRQLERVLPPATKAGLDAHLSVDPTQIGTMISQDLCRANARRLAEAVDRAPSPEGGHKVLMLDMEDSSVTEPTLALHRELREAGLPAGITVQAYLRRTPADLARLTVGGGFIRLVKGAFAEGPDIAHTRRQDVDRAYESCLELLFRPESRAAGTHPVVGSHDERMIECARRLAKDNGWRPDQWEVEMLLGVRPEFQRELVGQGVRLRLYLPFGQSWWPYSVRRVGETPKNAWFVLRAVFSKR